MTSQYLVRRLGMQPLIGFSSRFFLWKGAGMFPQFLCPESLPSAAFILKQFSASTSLLESGEGWKEGGTAAHRRVEESNNRQVKGQVREKIMNLDSQPWSPKWSPTPYVVHYVGNRALV